MSKGCKTHVKIYKLLGRIGVYLQTGHNLISFLWTETTGGQDGRRPLAAPAFGVA
jgi:hypothetical protein